MHMSQYHKGAVAPLYRDRAGWPASLPCIYSEYPRFRGNTRSIRNPSSQKGTYGQSMGSKWPKLDYRKVVKIEKVHFHILIVLLQFRLVYLNNLTELRNVTLPTDRYP